MELRGWSCLDRAQLRKTWEADGKCLRAALLHEWRGEAITDKDGWRDDHQLDTKPDAGFFTECPDLATTH